MTTQISGVCRVIQTVTDVLHLTVLVTALLVNLRKRPLLLVKRLLMTAFYSKIWVKLIVCVEISVKIPIPNLFSSMKMQEHVRDVIETVVVMGA